MSKLGWREVIAKAGGVDAAMLYGAPLRALVGELEQAKDDALSADERRGRALAHAVESAERAAALNELLAIERAAVARYAALVDPAQEQVAAYGEVVAAARDMAAKSVVSRRMAAALAALNQEER